MTLPEAAGLLLAFVARLVTGAQGHWQGAPPKAEQRIYFANHQSHFDWVLIWAALPGDLRAITRPIAARDYWTSTPLKHWITREIFNAVYVSRPSPKGDATLGSADEDPLEPLMEALRNGDSLVIFPEGTRGNQGEPAPFKAGLFHLAEAFPDVQLIPTCGLGTRMSRIRSSAASSARSRTFFISATRVCLTATSARSRMMAG